MKKTTSLLLITLFVALAFAGCASWKKNATTGYEVTGITLATIHHTATSLCAQGKISAGDCAKLKGLYTKARSAYLVAGDALIVALNTEDALEHKEGMERYQAAIAEVSSILPDLLRLATELGINW